MKGYEKRFGTDRDGNEWLFAYSKGNHISNTDDVNELVTCWNQLTRRIMHMVEKKDLPLLVKAMFVAVGKFSRSEGGPASMHFEQHEAPKVSDLSETGE